MDDDKYERTLDELETHACKWWPKEVQEEVQKLSILETLLGSQEKFISILLVIYCLDFIICNFLFKVSICSN